MRPLLLLALAAAASAAPDEPARPAKIGLCSACHGDDGRAGAAGTPRLAGQDRDYLVAALEAYRDGRREHPAMNAIAGTLGAADVEALAAWYASRAATAP